MEQGLQLMLLLVVFKHSGIGREAGEHGLEEFLEVKAVGGWS